MFHKKVLKMFLAVALAFVLTACGSPEAQNPTPEVPTPQQDTATATDTTTDEASNESASEGAQTTISLLGWGSPSEVEVFQTMIGQFEAKYPDVKVDYIHVPDTDFDTKLQTLIAAGDQPDVFYLRPEAVMKFADTGNLYDMSAYVADNEIFDEANVWKKALDFYRYDGTTPGVGNLYGLPKDISGFALAYNKDLFEKAGVPFPDKDKPWTWTEFLANCKKLTSGEGTDKVFGTGQYSLESAIWSNGADWLSADKKTVTIDDPKFIEALQWMADLSLVEGVMPSAQEEAALGSSQRWLEGKVAMIGTGSWALGQYWDDCDFDWDLMPWPASEATGNSTIWYGGMGFGVSPKSENVEAACNLAAFLAFNEESQTTNYKMGQAIPNLKDMAYNGFLQMTDKLPENKQEFLDIIENENYGRRATQTYTYDSEWFGEFNSGVGAVWSGEMTAKEYCEEMKDTIQDTLNHAIEKQAAAQK